MAIVAAMWLWTGVAYHALFFSAINKAAYIFAALFIVEGGALIYAGVYRAQLRFGNRTRPLGRVGVALLTYAAILYPLIGISTGHRYPEIPMFGVTPCPVTIFTFGLFLFGNAATVTLASGHSLYMVDDRRQRRVSFACAQDWPLLVSGFVAVPLIVFGTRRST